MASVQTSSYQGRYLKLTVVEESYSIPDNTSTVRWTLESIGGTSSYYTIYNCSVVVNGQQVYYSGTTYWSAKSFPATTGSVSGTLTISHNQDGSASDVWFTLHGKVYISGDDNVSGSIGLTEIPRAATITNAPNFNDEENPTINYSNPAGYNSSSLDLCISFQSGSADIPYRGVDRGSKSYTFNFTDEERNKLRTYCKNNNSLPITYYIRTGIGSTYYYSTQQATLSIVNGEPTIGNITYKDNDTNITAITKDNQLIVQNKSHLYFNFTNATPKKNSTISKYELLINNIKYTNTSTGVFDIGLLNANYDTEYEFIATDSRGNKASKKGTIKVLSYQEPTTEITIKRVSNYYDETHLKVNATISSVNDTNQVTIKYKYKKVTDTNYSSLVTTENNATDVLTLDNKYAYDFVIYVTDLFTTTSTGIVKKLNKGIPIEMIDTKKLSVGINTLPQHDNSLEIAGSLYLNGVEVGAGGGDSLPIGAIIEYDGTTVPEGYEITSSSGDLVNLIYPVGSIYMSVNNINPSTFFGGTWVSWGAGRVPVGVNTSDSEFNTVEKTGGEKTHTNVLNYDDGAAAIRNYANKLVYGDGAKNVGAMKNATSIWEFTHNNDYGSSADYAGVGLYGKTGAGSSLQPYITCYMWKRTA